MSNEASGSQERTIYEKLFDIQQALQVPKNLLNDHMHFMYRSAESILGAVKPLLKEQGMVIMLNDDLVVKNGRYYVKAVATLTDVKTGESIKTVAWAREEFQKKGMDASQVTGASSSYARKYALNGLFAIDDVKDSDATNTGEYNSQNSYPQNGYPQNQPNYPQQGQQYNQSGNRPQWQNIQQFPANGNTNNRPASGQN